MPQTNSYLITVSGKKELDDVRQMLQQKLRELTEAFQCYFNLLLSESKNTAQVKECRLC